MGKLGKALLNLTLLKKTILLTGVWLLLGIGLLSFLGIRAVDQATEAMLQDRLTTAGVVADYVDEAMARALSEMARTAQSLNLDAPASNATDIEALESTYSRLSIYPHALYLINHDGQIIWSKPTSTLVNSVVLSSQPSVTEALTTAKATTSGLVSAPLTDIPVVLLIGPIQGPQGVRGALVAAIELAHSGIGGFVKPIKLGETGYVEIVDQNGVVVARTEPGPKLAPFERSDHSGRFAALIAAGEPTRGTCHTCHETVQKVETRDVLAFVPLSQTPWGVVIRQSEDEAMAPIRRLRQNLLYSGAGILSVAFLFVGLTSRDIVRHLRMLTVSARRIAEGDLASPVTTSREDEVGVLAQTFDDMRARLRTSYEELEQRTKELSALLSVSQILASLQGLPDITVALGSALDRILEIARGNAGGILLLDKERELLCYKAYHGVSPEPSQEVCYRLGEGVAGKVALSGEPMVIDDISTDPRAEGFEPLADGIKAFVSVPLRSKDRVLGVINIASHEVGKFSARDVQLLEGIAAQIATAVENAELHQEVQHKEAVRGELLREILSIQEEERKRIARELHDETSQSLASLNANLEAAVGMLPKDIAKVKTTLRKAQALSINILDEIHRLIYELRPSLLDDMGLVAATRWLVDNLLITADIQVTFKTIGRERRLSPQLDTTLFRVIQEAVSNIIRHAQAKNAQIRLHFKRRTIEVHVSDDGKGFDVEEAITSKERPRGLGLLGMKERVELVNGTITIKSKPGSGSEIAIKIPLNHETLA